MTKKVVKQGVNCVFPKWHALYSSGVLPATLKDSDDHYPWFVERARQLGFDPDLHVERRDNRRYFECNVAVSSELFEKICGW